MKKLILLFASAMLVFNAMNALTPSLTIQKASKAVKVDGIVDSNDPWGTAWINMTVQKSTNTTSGMTAKFMSMYDDSALYIVLDITDDTQADTAPTNTYERDCMEVFVGLDTAAYWPTGNYKQGDFQFRQQWDNTTVYPWGFEVGQGNPAPVPAQASLADFKANPTNKTAMDCQATEYVTEWALAWSTLQINVTDSTMNAPQYTHFIKFDLQAADNTTNSTSGRTQQTYWYNGSDDQWHNVTKFGLVSLEGSGFPKAKPVGIRPVKSVSNFRITVNNNTLTIENGSKDLTIYNLTGQAVLKASLNTNTLNVNLPAGIYIGKSGNSTSKFVIK